VDAAANAGLRPLTERKLNRVKRPALNLILIKGGPFCLISLMRRKHYAKIRCCILLVLIFAATILFAEVLHKVMAYEIVYLIGDNFPISQPRTSRRLAVCRRVKFIVALPVGRFTGL
jgi:hypothetical protein